MASPATGPLPAELRRAREFLRARGLIPDISPKLFILAARETNATLEETLAMVAALLAGPGETPAPAAPELLEESA